MASAEFGEGAEEKRPTVQVGDPFSEKLLLEACLEIMAKNCVIAIQDMGAAGLTCSAVEMGAKGDLGVTLELDKVPTRETGMNAYEMMLSESQERMLMVLKPEKEKASSSTTATLWPTCRSRSWATRHRNTTALSPPAQSRRSSGRQTSERRWGLPTRWNISSARPISPPSAGCGSNTTTSSAAIPSSARAATPR
jgi:hypothetical protein